jgi:phage terminase large subunit-like protein
VASRAAARKPRRARVRRPEPPTPWWGDSGPAPHARYPGVTIEVPCAWSGTRKRWESPDGQFYFDTQAADFACAFFSTYLSHHIGEFAGQPFELLEYQRLLIVRPLFGWKRASDDLRRFRDVFVFVPKGNGKSPLGAGLGLLTELCDDEPAAEVYAVASDKEQGKVVHETAKIMVEESADLAEECQVLKDSIYHPKSRSFFKAIPADATGAHGFRPHCVIFDELHTQKNRGLFDALRKSLMKRRQPLFIMFSHAGEDDESVCYEEYEKAKAVVARISNDESYLPVIFELGEKDDWTDVAALKRVNPGYGVTVNPIILAADCRQAQEEPRKRNSFLLFHTNRWAGSAEAWIPIETWAACPDLVPEEELRITPCAAGLDMSQKIDLASFSVTFRLPLASGEKPQDVEVAAAPAPGRPGPILGLQTPIEALASALAAPSPSPIANKPLSINFRLAIVTWCWLPEATLQKRAREDRVPYDLWRDREFVFATEGAVIDDDRIYHDILTKILPRFPLLKQAEIGYDPAFATSLALRLQAGGLKMVEIPQNYTFMNEPCHALEALVIGGRVHHDHANELLKWTVGNCAVKRDDAGRIRPVKPRSAKKRIDPVVATLMGLNRLLVSPTPARSVYEDRGVRELRL